MHFLSSKQRHVTRAWVPKHVMQSWNIWENSKHLRSCLSTKRSKGNWSKHHNCAAETINGDNHDVVQLWLIVIIMRDVTLRSWGVEDGVCGAGKPGCFITIDNWYIGSLTMMTMTMRNEDVEPYLSVSGQKIDRKRTRSRRLPHTWFRFVNMVY